MRRFMGIEAMLALALLAMPAVAGDTCTDISDQCQTTALEDCTDAVDATVTIQIGGLEAEDSDDNGGTCVGVPATALFTFKKVSPTELEVTVENSTCGDVSTLTAAFWNTTTTVTSLSNLVTSAVSPDVVDTTWNLGYDQTLADNDGHGFKADGFGNFDAVIHNGDSESPNGGDPTEILAGETLIFDIEVQPGFNLCDILTEISLPPPGDRNRTAVGRFQSCGVNGDSAFIGPCLPDGDLLAVIDYVLLVPGDHNMRVEWATSLEIENAGFNVLRREATRGGWERVNVDLIPGQGDTVTGAAYAFDDKTALNGVEYMYRIEDIDFDGRNNLSEISKDVTNPLDPPIKLVEPAYGASVDLRSRPHFGFEGSASRGNMIMEISGDPAFADGSIVSTHVSRRFLSTEFTLDPRTTRLATKMAEETEGIVYWRLVDRTREPVSDTFRMQIQGIGMN